MSGILDGIQEPCLLLSLSYMMRLITVTLFCKAIWDLWVKSTREEIAVVYLLCDSISTVKVAISFTKRPFFSRVFFFFYAPL